jgi:hypothetical protein
MPSLAVSSSSSTGAHRPPARKRLVTSIPSTLGSITSSTMVP